MWNIPAHIQQSEIILEMEINEQKSKQLWDDSSKFKLLTKDSVDPAFQSDV